jgi:hypothetical protein
MKKYLDASVITKQIILLSDDKYHSLSLLFTVIIYSVVYIFKSLASRFHNYWKIRILTRTVIVVNDDLYIKFF